MHDLETDTYEIDPVDEVFAVGKKMGVFINSKGALWTGSGGAFFNGVSLGVGEATIKKAIADSPETYLALRDTIVSRMGKKVTHETTTDPEPDAAEEDDGVLLAAQAGLGFE